jgi:hypothetical protein
MDVGAWLRNLGLEQYEAALRDNSVDADVLPRLTGEDLKELGIASVGHRRKLLDAISELRSATPATAGPETPISPRPPASPGPARVSEIAAERRPITVMFCDLVGSTSLAAKLCSVGFAAEQPNAKSSHLDPLRRYLSPRVNCAR